MIMSLPLTSEFLKILSTNPVKNLQVLPSSQIKNDPFLSQLFHETNFPTNSDPTSSIMEILISKEFLAKMFIECHNVIEEQSPIDPARPIDEKLLYHATLGILLVTPEDHTALNYNEKILNKMIDDSTSLLESHFNVLSGYLASSISRTNKSSSLWLYFKKTLIKLLSHKFQHHKQQQEQNDSNFTQYLFSKSLQIIIQSTKNHPRNYYSNNTTRFLISILRHYTQSEILNEYYTTILEYLKKDGINDYSMWMTLLQLVQPSYDESYYIDEFTRLAGDDNSALFSKYDDKRSIDFSELFINDVYRFLTRSKILSYSGWHALTLLSIKHKEQTTAAILETLFKTSHESFEKSNDFIIDVKSGTLRRNQKEVNLDSDLILNDEFKLNLIYKKLYRKFFFC